MQWTLAALFTALAVAGHLTFFLHAGPFWRDEANSVRLALMPSLADTWAALRYDSFPLLLSALLRGWSVLGESDLALRGFGLLVGLGILGAMWLNAWRLGRTVPVLSLALVGLSPLVIRFGDALRPYGVGTLFLLLTVAAVWGVCASPTPWRVAGAAVSAVLSVQSLYTNAVLLAAVCLAGLAVALRNRRRRSAVAVLGVGVLAALSLLPYGSRVAVAGDWAVVVRTPPSAAKVSDGMTQAFGAAEPDGLAGRLALAAWVGLYLLGIPAALFRLRRSAAAPPAEKDLLLFAVVLVVAATAAAWGFVWWARVGVQPWYFLPMLAAAGAGFEAIVGRLARPVRWLAAAWSVVLMLLAFQPARQELRWRQSNVDRVADILNEKGAPEDLVLVNPWYYGMSFSRYYHGAAPVRTLPPLEDITIHRFDLIKKRMVEPDPLAGLIAEIDERLRGGHRVWLVGNLPPSPGAEPYPLPAPAPGGPHGWNAELYLNDWRLRVRRWLESHSGRNSAQVRVVDQDVNQLERVGLREIRGR